MATHFSGVGDISMENPGTQDMDNISEEKFFNMMKILFRNYFARQNV